METVSEKVCRVCKLLKAESEFAPSKFKQNNPICIDCNSKYYKQYYQDNKDRLVERKRKYSEENREEINAKARAKWASDEEYRKNALAKANEYKRKNKEVLAEKRKQYMSNLSAEEKQRRLERRREWTEENRDSINANRRAYTKNRRDTDPTFSLEKAISNSIRIAIKKRGASKNGESCLDYLGYKIDQLKQHLEALFEPWMNWHNWGPYNVEAWNDNDQSTWTWHIDHIVPHCNFKYKTMDCQEFRDCWALSNLRPLSAKQNCLEKDRRNK